MTDQKELRVKRGELKIIDELRDYVIATYNQHYRTENEDGDEIQVLDIWEALDMDIAAMHSNIVKYAFRYGRKNGYNRKDLFKILHYTVLLIHYSEQRGLFTVVDPQLESV